MGIVTEGTKQDGEQHQSDQKALVKRETLRAYNRAYYLAHQQEICERSRTYYQQNRTKVNAQQRKRYKKDPTPFLICSQAWVAKNRERRRLSQKA